MNAIKLTITRIETIAHATRSFFFDIICEQHLEKYICVNPRNYPRVSASTRHRSGRTQMMTRKNAEENAMGKQGQYSKYLSKNEVLIAVVRRSLTGYVWEISLALFLVLLTSFLSVPLLAGPFALNILFAFLAVAAIWSVVRFVAMFTHDVLLVTDTRIIDIDQHGIITRTVSDAAYDRITDITWSRRGIFEWLTRCGGVACATAGSSYLLEIRPVRHPQKVHALIREVMEVNKKS